MDPDNIEAIEEAIDACRLERQGNTTQDVNMDTVSYFQFLSVQVNLKKTI